MNMIDDVMEVLMNIHKLQAVVLSGSVPSHVQLYMTLYMHWTVVWLERHK